MNYDAKGHYRSDEVAHAYEEQFRSPLRLANLRAKLIDAWERRAFRRLLGHVESNGGVLDIACGTGRYCELLLGNGFEVGGMDVSPQMLALARARVGAHPRLMFLREGDAENLPFEAGEFDGLTCMRLYHRVPSAARAKMLREGRRVARRWSILFFGIATPWLDARRRVRQRILGRSSTPFPTSIAEMLAELEEAGWRARAKAWVLPGLADGLLVLCETK